MQSFAPYTLKMRIAPNVKCQRVFVLAIRLVISIVSYISWMYSVTFWTTDK